MSLTSTADLRVQAVDPAPRSQVLLANISGAARFGGRLLRAAGTYREWGCAPISEIGPDTSRLRLRGPWRNGLDRFWADPCISSAGGQTWLFMEELIRSTGRGHIVAAPVLNGDIDTSRVRTVLANDHHLSFPQVQRYNGRWVATVETCAGHNPFYEFDAMGEPWREYDGLAPLPPHTADPVADLALMGDQFITQQLIMPFEDEPLARKVVSLAGIRIEDYPDIEEYFLAQPAVDQMRDPTAFDAEETTGSATVPQRGDREGYGFFVDEFRRPAPIRVIRQPDPSIHSAFDTTPGAA